MGSSLSYSGGGTGGSPNKCGDVFEFRVILAGSEHALSNLVVGDEIKIDLVEDGLPVLEVIALKDGTCIGIVPPSLSMIIRCIRNGWEYYGTILEIKSSIKRSEVSVRVVGER